MANPLLNLITGYNELREQEEQKGNVETKGSEELKADTEADQQTVDEKDVENLSVEEKVDLLSKVVQDLFIKVNGGVE
ncbi:hypothetical protein C2I27_16550 [Priestia megaterium]|uniref:hypothetical protein n=1 Tax=Priestia megaterium TaxID=1404 RepID=UPI000D512F74|nr:hypothetical protein [Priestia megaterium]MCM3546590.1 hypothetical protein [Priestia megaterium]PVC67416.1 hypothetical protein C2I27_16550 [Priestia megaterium]